MSILSIDSDATGFKDEQLEEAELQLILISARNLLSEIKVLKQFMPVPRFEAMLEAAETLRRYTKD